MNIQQIIDCIPHRYPFLLVDRVLEFELGKSLLAIKNVTINEPFFKGHFPIKAVMPGVLIVEALAQAGAILASKSTSPDLEPPLFYLASLENARFKRIVVPGDQLLLKIEVLKRRDKFWKVRGVASVKDEIACTVEITSVGAGKENS